MSFQKYGNRLMIVAHPDDESIFGGGSLISGMGWRVICLTNASNNVRSNEFKKAMEFVGAKYEIWDYPDEYDGSFDEERVRKAIELVLKSERFELLVTHSLHGEYGHSQHKSLSRILHDMHLENLQVFDTSDDKLPEDIIEQKMRLLGHYPSQKHVIEALNHYIMYERVIDNLS